MIRSSAGVARIVCCAWVVLCLAGGVGLSASGAVPTLEQRAQGAQTIVVATARSIAPRWEQNDQRDRYIVSRFLLQVEETLKGASTDALWLDVEGGTLDGVTLQVSSLPEMKPGERAVFFLERNGDAAYQPYLRGFGILKLNDRDQVQGTSLALDQIRNVVRGVSR